MIRLTNHDELKSSECMNKQNSAKNHIPLPILAKDPYNLKTDWNRNCN